MIRQLNIHDILNISNELKSLTDSKVQNIFATEDSIGLELYQKSVRYLWLYLNQKSPQVFLFDKIPKVFKLKKTTPVLLFLKAHLVGKRISEVVHDSTKGRVINLRFGYDDPVEIEVRLFPHGANLLAQSSSKSISLYKSKELKAASETPEAIEKIEPRSVAQISEEFLNQKQTSKTKKDPEAVRQELISKKQKALDKMIELLKTQSDDKWKELGLWLTENQTLSVPEEFKNMIPDTMGFSDAIQFCFEKAKKNSAKIEGTKARIESLQREIEKLQTIDASQFTPQAAKEKKTKTDTWTGYRLSLDSQVEVFVGKNAKENLTILRHAQSWDYWLHIKDYPGAHGIIRRPRHHEITLEQFEKAAQFVASRSKRSAHFLSSGDRVDVLVVERRYVRPIKGDKLGRVTFSNEKVLQILMP